MEPQSEDRTGSAPCFEPNDWRNRGNLNNMSISELISELRGTFIRSDFNIVEDILVSREATLKAEIEEKKKKIEVLGEKVRLERMEKLSVDMELKRVIEERKKAELGFGRCSGEMVKKRRVGDGVVDLEDGSVLVKEKRGVGEHSKKDGVGASGELEFERCEVDVVNNRGEGKKVGALAGERRRVGEQRKKSGLGASGMSDRIRQGNQTMTESVGREREAANLAPKRARGCGIEETPTSQTGPSQIMDPTQKHEPQDDNHVEEEPEHPNVGYPGGPSNTLLLTKFGSHVAHHVWINQPTKIRERVVAAIGHGKRLSLKSLPRPDLDEAWFWNIVGASGLGPLLTTCYDEINNASITALTERWHPETSSFHLPVGEMTVTLDDVQCLLHVPVVGKLLDHSNKISYEQGYQLMVELLGIDRAEAEKETGICLGPYIRFRSLLISYHTQWSIVKEMMEDPTVEGDLEYHQHCMIRCFLLYLVGCTLLTNKSKKYIDLIYLEAMRNVRAISEYAWGAMGLAQLYHFLGKATIPHTKTCAGYMSLLLAWAMEHFPTYYVVDLNPQYTDDMPRATRYLVHNRGHKYPDLYMQYLDSLEVNEVVWCPYEGHRQYGWPLREICWYTGWITAGKAKVYLHLPERVLRQYGHIQIIPRHPSHVVHIEARLIHQAYFNYAMHVLPEHMRGETPCDPWKTIDGYMQWFYSVSHPRMLPQK